MNYQWLPMSIEALPHVHSLRVHGEQAPVPLREKTEGLRCRCWARVMQYISEH